VSSFVFEVVVQVVDVDIAIAERFPRSKVEVSSYFVYPDASFNAATFLALSIKPLSIMLSRTLFHVLASTKGPRYLSVGISDLVASITTPGFGCVFRCRCTIALSTVTRIQMNSVILMSKIPSVPVPSHIEEAFIRNWETHKSKDLISN
jgi:hypothetical protein